MQPREAGKGPTRALGWHIACDNNLTVTLVVADRYILLRSNPEAKGASAWRMGVYMDADDARQKAVDMTESYEKLRHGKIGTYGEMSFPDSEWDYSIEEGALHPKIMELIEAALSPIVSPIAD